MAYVGRLLECDKVYSCRVQGGVGRCVCGTCIKNSNLVSADYATRATSREVLFRNAKHCEKSSVLC